MVSEKRYGFTDEVRTQVVCWIVDEGQIRKNEGNAGCDVVRSV